MRLRSAIIWNGISQLGQSGITFISTIILARLLTPDDFGIIGIVSIFIAFSQMIVDSEMGGALLRKKEVTDVDYSTLFYYNLGVSIILYLILYFIAPLIANFYEKPQLIMIIRIISFTIIIHAFRVVQRIILFRDLRFKETAIINIISGGLSLLGAIFLAERSYGYWSLVWQQIILAISNVILMECFTKFIPLMDFSRESFKYQFSFGISLLGSDTVKTLANNISTNIIAKIASLQLTGYYTQTSRITNFCQSSLGSILDQSVFPVMAKIGEIRRIKFLYYKLLKFIFIILGVITLIIWLFSAPLIVILLGDEWINGAWMLQILAISIIPTSVQLLCRNILKTLAETKLIFSLETIKSALVVAFLLGAIFFGAKAVIWSLVVSQMFGCAIWMMYTSKTLNRHEQQ